MGSGMGGGTTALALARRGVDVLVVERGERLPREPENWSPRAVFMERRYKPAERWLDGAGRSFAPGRPLRRRRQHQGLWREPAAVPRARLRGHRAPRRNLARVAFPLRATSSPTTRRPSSIYRVHGATGERSDRALAQHAVPVSRPRARALRRRPRRAPARPGRASEPERDGAWTCGAGGTCIRCRTCDGFPCMVGAKRDAETCALDPALATGHVRLLTGDCACGASSPIRAGPGSWVSTPRGRDGPLRVGGDRFVLAAGAVNSAALLLASADERHPADSRTAPVRSAAT